MAVPHYIKGGIMNFHETKMGRAFFEHQVPQLIDALKALTAVLSKPAPTAVLPVTADPTFLRDLFFGDYEPAIFKVSPEFQRLNQTVDQAHKFLERTLSEDSKQRLEEYEATVSARNVAVMEQAYRDGVHAAVQMIIAGLADSGIKQPAEKETEHEC